MADTVLITGASSGIGRALAITMAADGHNIIAVARSEDKLNELSREYPTIHGISCDLSELNELKNLFDQLSTSYPAIDKLILNAGTCEYLDVEETAWTDLYQKVFAVNVESTLNMMEHALPMLKRSKSPQVVCIASMVTLYPFVRAEIYGASKAAIDYMMAAFRVDLEPLNIKVTTIYPGFVKTPLTDRNDFEMPFLVSAEDAAKRMYNAIKKAKKTYYFPKRLLLTLKFLSLLDFIGFRPAALKQHKIKK